MASDVPLTRSKQECILPQLQKIRTFVVEDVNFGNNSLRLRARVSVVALRAEAWLPRRTVPGRLFAIDHGWQSVQKLPRLIDMGRTCAVTHLRLEQQLK